MTDYVKSHSYESFIILCRNCERGDKFGAHNQYMLNLIYKEKDDTVVREMKHSTILNTVKTNLISATEFAIKGKLSKSDKELLFTYIDKIQKAQTSSELTEICEDGIELLLKYKPSSDSI